LLPKGEWNLKDGAPQNYLSIFYLAIHVII
jgi:hypothetical protein